MEGFKSNPKMQCFKEGGQVKYETRKEHAEEMSADVAKDKAIVKKAFKIHDTQSHEGEKTNLSKLRKGGRAKKECGTVKKYKTGGSVENAYGAKKTDKDMKDIANSKRQKPKMLCGGGKSYADGGLVEAVKSGATKLKENILGTPEQNKTAQENLDKQAAQGSKLAKVLGGEDKNQQDYISGVKPKNPRKMFIDGEWRDQAAKKRGGKVC